VDRHQSPVSCGSGKSPIKHYKSKRKIDGGNAGGAAQIEIFSFRAVFEEQNKAYPFFYLPLKKKRGETAKMQNPLWEQGVGSLDIPRGFPMGIFGLHRRANCMRGKAEAPPESLHI
jgi:hypothetical protein